MIDWLEEEQAAAVEKYASETDSDVLLYSGSISGGDDHQIVDLLAERRIKRKKLTVLLTTNGGSPDSAFRTARVFQSAYPKNVKLLVDDRCKSAGTLIALGAHHLTMSDHAELGPLDIQMSSREEVGELDSGLTPFQSLDTLREEAATTFDHLFRKLRYRSSTDDYQFSTKLAAEIAAQMSTGLFSEIFKQIDPMRLGAMKRAMSIGEAYGERIKTNNVKDSGLAMLLSNYPSHGFVIDRKEAGELFESVAPPTDVEYGVIEALASFTRWGMIRARNGQPSVIAFMSQPVPDEGSAVEPQPEDNHDNSDTAADSGDQAGATGEDESNASTGESKAGSKKPRKTTKRPSKRS